MIAYTFMHLWQYLSQHCPFKTIHFASNSNVKTDKISTNVPTSNRNETVTSEFVPESALTKEIISIWSWRADSGPNQNNLFSTIQIRECTKTFWFRFQTI